MTWEPVTPLGGSNLLLRPQQAQVWNGQNQFV